MNTEANEHTDEAPWDWSEKDRNRVEEMNDRRNDAGGIFRELVNDNDPFGYWRAWATVGGLWDLVLIDRDLSAYTPVQRLVEPATRLHSLLPFNDNELQQLSARMEAQNVAGHRQPEYADRWYETAGPEDMAVLTRWRQWLDSSFPSYAPEPDQNGKELLSALDDMERVFVDIV